MKNTLLYITTMLVVFTLLLTGCSSPASPTAGPIEEQIAEETPVPTVEIVSTATTEPSPTPAPTAIPPFPCMISFDTDRDGNWEIYVMGPDGSDQQNISNNPGDDFEPSWSPDGKQIAFASNRETDGEGGQYIYVVNADGSDVRKLSDQAYSEQPDWSHNGRMIVYSGNGDIRIIPADGSGPSINLTNTPGKDWKPSWSPDDSRILWMSGQDDRWDIWTMKADGSDAVQLTFNGRVSYAEWSVDGRIFANWENPEGVCFNCIMDADGSNVMDAGGKGSIQQYLPFWTVDGDRVECAGLNLNGNEEIYLVGEIFPDIFLNLTNNQANDRNPDWAANCGPADKTMAQEELPVEEQAAEPENGGITLGYAGDEEWEYQKREGFTRACEELGINCIFGEIPELINAGVSAIVQNSNSTAVNGLFESVRMAKDKGIPVFILDAEANFDGAYNVTIDKNRWAKTSLGWLFEKANGGEVAYFDLNPFDRFDGTINELLAAYPVTVVEKRDGKYDASKIKPETIDFIMMHPELKAVWSSLKMNDMLWGLIESAIPQKEWPLINCDATGDGLETWLDVKKKNSGFECIAVANPPGIAYDAAYAAYYLVSGFQLDETALGGPYGNTLYVNFPEITNDNLEEWLELARKEKMTIIDERMPPEQILADWFVE